MRRLVVIASAGIVLMGCLAVAAGWILARPVQRPIGPAPIDLDARPVVFESTSGAEVHAWWCPVEGAAGSVVLLPGVRANRLSMVERARFLRQSGFSVLLLDLQGTGETVGREITFGWRERHDVTAAVGFVRRQTRGGRVAVLGSSLGGAAALLAVPPLQVDAAVLEAVYPSIERATRNRLILRFGRFGRIAAPLLLAQLRPRIGVGASQLRPIDHIGRLRCPVFILSGAEDRHTTPADTMLLYRAAHSPKQLWIIAGMAHVDLHHAAAQKYEQRVSEFLHRAFSAGTA